MPADREADSSPSGGGSVNPSDDESAPTIEDVEVVGLIGEGATSRVYLGIQHPFGRDVAVKVLRIPARSGLATALYNNENRALGQLTSHPNILTVFDGGTTEDGYPYLMSEYLPEGSLGKRVRASGSIPWPEVVAVGVQLAGALETVHVHGIVHGDVNASNVLTGRTGQPVLGDFGIAIAQATLGPGAVSEIVPRGGAPELGDGDPPSTLTDVFGLSACLRELLGADIPTGAVEDGTLVDEDSTGMADDPVDVPEDLLDLLAAGTAKDPSHRPSSADALGLALQEVQRSHGQPVTPLVVMQEVVPESLSEQISRSPFPDAATTSTGVAAFSGRSLAGVCGLAALVLAVVLGAAWILISDPAAPVTQDETTDAVEQGDQPVAETTVAESADPPEGPPVTEVLPESNIQGVQPGVEYYDAGPTDPHDGMDMALAEESVIFHPLGGLEVQPSPHYGAPFASYPARFNFQSFNSASDGLTCRGIMTRSLTVTDMWERGVTWPTGRFQVSVAHLDSPWMAHEMATALSLAAGVESPKCRGMARFGVEDYDDYGVFHRDRYRLMSSGDTHNHWSESDVALGDHTWSDSTRMVLESGEYVVDIGLVTDEPLFMGDDEAVAQVATQIINRL